MTNRVPTTLRAALCASVILGALTIVPVTARAQTNVSGDQSGTWTKANSPYNVTGTITVPAGETLTIEGGVNVRFNADVHFILEGAIHTLGTETDSVRFITGTSVWRGIRISGGDSSTFSYTRISDGNARHFATSDQYGGGLYISGEITRVSMDHCVISGNTAGMAGGGLFNQASTVSLTNCTISNNTAHSGGGLYNSNGTIMLANCTISGNTATGSGGGGGLRNAGTATLTNCILWANSSFNEETVQLWHDDNCVTTSFYSNIQGGLPAGVTDGGGNIGADEVGDDPLFRNAEAGDFRLMLGSPCIDAGDPFSALDPDGTRADMGAFYFDQTQWLALPNIIAPEEFVIEITGTIFNAYGVNFAFNFNPGVISAGTPLVVSTAFDGLADASIIANATNDTVAVALAASEPVTVIDGVIATLRFNAVTVGVSGLEWMPHTVEIDEVAPHKLTSGSVSVFLGILFGDVTGDGLISALDASWILQQVVYLRSGLDPLIADVSGNGTVSAYDAALVLYKVVNPLYVFPVQGGAPLKPAAPPVLAWERADGAWVLRTDTPGMLGADLVLRLPAGAEFASGAALEFTRDGDLVTIAVASVEATDLLRITGVPGVPEVLRASVNEQDVIVTRPVEFSLSQNAPNPFNPITTLRFGVAEAGAVRLAIYDVNGREVRTLVDGNLTAGHHEVVWDARDNVGRAVASGVYVYRLTSGDNAAMRRMVLVR